MAAIAPRLSVALCLAWFIISPLPARADDSAEVHSVIADVATALSNGDAALAMAGFSKSYAGYDKLSADFDALSQAYYVESQIEFTDENVADAAATVTVHWAMTLTTRQSGFTKNRNSDITLKLARERKHWRIVEISPIAIFDPAN